MCPRKAEGWGGNWAWCSSSRVLGGGTLPPRPWEQRDLHNPKGSEGPLHKEQKGCEPAPPCFSWEASPQPP